LFIGLLGVKRLSIPHKFDTLTGKRTISLTTYYKSGKSVSTPVEYVRVDDKLYVSTPEASYKVKRIRGNSTAVIASCTMRGKITGPNIDVQVRILSEEEGKVAQEAVDVLFQGLFYRIWLKLMPGRKKEKRVILEII
jgi:PPOX class probable F420-dependent enzyme